ncbi:LytTR family DNA-binding domain-containing protein [Bacillus sp. B15-48]|uniref:LytR/AlgR family response regulator transcription factor n=1 Tax=Bacillus sp. B15-48 TaxID=1548601 RepID=UPI00193FED2B|nr:LytTR family DNA-binding domain-containing protein [Bacillus sp. B15-48]MBM4763614.1 response regulator [Bacillus sp. B15-48]
MNEIRVMIAEDERMARQELFHLLNDEKGIIHTPHAETGEQVIELYSEHRPDVIFLDIEMPGMTGIEAARLIMKQASDSLPLLVFTTAYDDYAIDAFDVEAVDYLLKPYDEKRFQRTMTRIRKSFTSRNRANETVEKKEKTTVSKLLIDDGERMVVVSPDSIYYAVPNKRLLEIHTEDKVILSRMTLQELEDQLVGHSFFRAHRSYLVNLNHVLEISPWFNGTSNLTLKDKDRTKIPVSRSASKTILDVFKS